jgi:hypothetical protein
MSRRLGAAVPEELLALLQGADAGPWADQAVLIATADHRGRPHPALLSFDELYAPDAHRLRLGTYADSSTTENLRVRGALTLCFAGPGRVYYVKAVASEVHPPGAPGEPPGVACFEARIEDVLLDFARSDVEGPVDVLSGITFRRSAAQPALRERLRQA